MEKMREVNSVNEITKGIFTDIVIFTVAEPGAMGAPCLMEFVSKTGDMFCLYYDKIYDFVITHTGSFPTGDSGAPSTTR